MWHSACIHIDQNGRMAHEANWHQAAGRSGQRDCGVIGHPGNGRDLP
jgi:hypothetical protein